MFEAGSWLWRWLADQPAFIAVGLGLCFVLIIAPAVGPGAAPIGMEVPNPWKHPSVRAELLYVWLPTIGLVVLVDSYRYCRRRWA